MRVLMLSWEYPPLLVGGLGRHVEGLARTLAGAGHDVRVVARGEGLRPEVTEPDGVRLYRAAADPVALDFTTESLLAWSQASEHALLRAALPLLRRWRPDVVHAHDWLVAQSAITVAESTGAPLVTTMHATEFGRNQGCVERPLSVAIDSFERWLTQRSTAVITCSTTMRDEVVQRFDLPGERISVIPNAIDAAGWRRLRRTERTDGPVLAYTGRLTPEKGVQTLLTALPRLRDAHPGLRLLVAGAGNHDRELQAQARRLRIGDAVDWLGFLSGRQLRAVFADADVVVMPSLYEPFGIAALEAAASGTPLVVADTGGLRDLVRAGVATGSFPAADVAGLVTAVAEVLADPAAAKRSAARAARIVRRDYTWPVVAERTAAVYTGALAGRNVR